MTDTKVFDPDIESSRTIATLSYLWILFLVPLLLQRKSKFAQFHAKQGLVLFVIEFVLAFFMWIPFIGQILFLVVVIVAAIGFIKTYNGEYWKIPFIYQWSQKIKF